MPPKSLTSRPILSFTRISPWWLSTQLRPFASTCRLRSQHDIVSLSVGGSGSFELRITKPTRRLKNGEHWILVHLPSSCHVGGCNLGPAKSQWPDAAALSKRVPATAIVEINYRLSARPQHGHQELDHRFPTPIHDVFKAWAYITEDLAPSLAGKRDGLVHTQRPKICLVGSHIGGALALTLALTNPNDIDAVAVQDPLVDWTGLDELAAASTPGSRVREAVITRSKTRKEQQRERVAAAAKALMELRTRLFRTPSGYFDAFASPMLFLRAPGRDTPLTKTAALGLAEKEEYSIDGVKMRYGDEDHEVGFVEGHEHDVATEAEALGFGPYDDDWHTAETKGIRDEYYHGRDTGDAAVIPDHPDCLVKADLPHAKQTASDQPPSPAVSKVVVPARRRKVLQRWPPNAQPEEALLPHVNVYIGPPMQDAGKSEVASHILHDQERNVDISPVTRLQGIEMVDLLRRACFWGREKSFAEERVTLTDYSSRGSSKPNEAVGMSLTRDVIDWLKEKLEDR